MKFIDLIYPPIFKPFHWRYRLPGKNSPSRNFIQFITVEQKCVLAGQGNLGMSDSLGCICFSIAILEQNRLLKMMSWEAFIFTIVYVTIVYVKRYSVYVYGDGCGYLCIWWISGEELLITFALDFVDTMPWRWHKGMLTLQRCFCCSVTTSLATSTTDYNSISSHVNLKGKAKILTPCSLALPNAG